MSKQCLSCGTAVDDNEMRCQVCGGTAFAPIQQQYTNAPQDFNQQGYEQQNYAQPQYQGYEQQNYAQPQYQGYEQQYYNYEQPQQEVQPQGNGNIAAGIAGAFLFSLVGGLIYFGLYQLGYIMGVCGLITFLLSFWGYRLFAKTKNKKSIPGIVASVIFTVIMLFAAEYFSVSFALYEELKTLGVKFADVLGSLFDILKLSEEATNEVVSDLVFSYVFAAIGIVSNFLPQKKNKKGIKGLKK